ncbi:pyridoxal-phosphate dependent enzyme [Brucella pituitosa]|uniref:Pyridoxal-phosphate dependent enzyme n=1 Tax=Brucella pituitosa TaxID=571256 RepID=A0A643ETR0_9HYPH|nr:pyridoxal-phosphate dependent enzyme [Brucella pituitosa]
MTKSRDTISPSVDEKFATQPIGSLAFSVLQKIGIRTLAASDAGVIEAQAHMAHETGIKAEPRGALALAAISESELPRQYGRLWVIVCGGNV